MVRRNEITTELQRFCSFVKKLVRCRQGISLPAVHIRTATVIGNASALYFFIRTVIHRRANGDQHSYCAGLSYPFLLLYNAGLSLETPSPFFNEQTPE